ncbi:MAG TPA: D-alanine--D-alanine ligase family protein [Terriglobia bacterium]|nr:D-alanine--D-alanine ligase family protein [Terriglobia bacterium]
MSTPAKIRIGVIFGGRSGEHEVSLRSAESVLRALDPEKYDVVPIAISHEGHWFSSGNPMKMLPAKDAIQKQLSSGQPAAISAEVAGKRPFDVVFPVLHGTYGEDGTIQGLLELADIPYVGAGVLGSAVGMDKDVMKRLLRDAGLPIVDYWALRSNGIHDFIREHGSKLPYPVFVKPANLGSSVGISKAHNIGELPAALAAAAQFDRKIIVERGVDAREIEVAVLGNDNPEVSVPGEVVPAREFYDYQAKYVNDDSRILIPAPLTAEQAQTARELGRKVFQVLEGSGLGRVDLFLEKATGKFYVNEINTLPGFTSISQYPKLWEASGLPYPKLVDRLVELAFERHAEKSKLKTKY